MRQNKKHNMDNEALNGELDAAARNKEDQEARTRRYKNIVDIVVAVEDDEEDITGNETLDVNEGKARSPAEPEPEHIAKAAEGPRQRSTHLYCQH